MMTNFSTIGILGGMGPEATNRLCALITELTPVGRDQDHIPVITYNNPQIPDRVKAVRGDGESPAPEMIRTAAVLEEAGADLLLIPCNLAHAYLDQVQAAVAIPILNMIAETVAFITANYPKCVKAGLIASTPTIESGLYADEFGRHKGPRLISPEHDVQESKVMSAIYGKNGIKCGYKTRPRALLMEAAQTLIDSGAQVIIAGCTEVSLVMPSESSSYVVIDPMEVIAKVAVEMARRGDAIAQHKASASYRG